jgi:hypothetical protein
MKKKVTARKKKDRRWLLRTFIMSLMSSNFPLIYIGFGLITFELTITLFESDLLVTSGVQKLTLDVNIKDNRRRRNCVYSGLPKTASVLSKSYCWIKLNTI